MTKLQEIINASQRIKQDSDFLTSQIAQLSQCFSTLQPNFMMIFTIFILACFVGYFVVWKVTPALHTALMSVTNAISGVIIVGAIIALGSAQSLSFTAFLAFFAIIIASINIFGGFFITYKMLEMFKK
jgi:H+-translocating NAD(P) transhydrogenase subunit alpha